MKRGNLKKQFQPRIPSEWIELASVSSYGFHLLQNETIDYAATADAELDKQRRQSTDA